MFRRLQPRERVFKNPEAGWHIWKVEENQLNLKGGNDFSSKRNKEKSRPSRQKKMMAGIIRMSQLPENDLGEEAFRLQEGFSNTTMAGSLHPYCLSLRI